MDARRFPVTFAPAGVTVWAEEGTTVLEAARHAGIIIPSPCGTRGVCGKCAVKVVEGTVAPPDDEEQVGLKLAPPGVRLACRMRVVAPVTVRPVVAVSVSAEAGEVVEDEALVAGVDLGTTSVGAVVVGEHSGRQLGRASAPNRQVTWGSDVLSRVSAALDGDADALSEAAHASIIDALSAACGKAGSCLENVRRVVIAGNTVMASLLLGLDVDGLAAHPFVSQLTQVTPVDLESPLGRMLPPDAETIVLPPVAAFVGGDAVAAIIAGGLVDAGRSAMLVDMGTNAEVAVVQKEHLAVASAAAGPALEGFGITCGGPFAPGAITNVAIGEGSVTVQVHGGVAPAWLAGSGLVSAIASMRRAGVVTADGLLRTDGPLSENIVQRDGINGFVLAEGDDASVILFQTDIRAFQQAKAGVTAAILMAARSQRVKPRKLDAFVVTGALGAAIAADDLVEMGVIPKDARDVIESVEAAALTGAAMIATNPALFEDAMVYIDAATHLDLAAVDGFTDIFMGALSLEPYTLKKGV